jgi:dihydrofolate reductase
MKICAIAAISKYDRAIGKQGQIPWHIPEDFKHFKELTTGHPVIMGRRTWESLPLKSRPLPNRTNIIISNDGEVDSMGSVVVSTIEDALAVAKEAPGNDLVFIIGGGQIYKATLPFVEQLHLTIVDQEVPGDAFFPDYESEFEIIAEEQRDGFSFQTLERKK